MHVVVGQHFQGLKSQVQEAGLDGQVLRGHGNLGPLLPSFGLLDGF